MDFEDGLALIVLIISALTTRLGWIAFGALLVIGGTIYGCTSHQITYQIVDHTTLTPYFVSDGTEYFQRAKSSTFYIFHETDFSPTFVRADFFKSDGGFSHFRF